ncbi:MAG: hypothetical protein ACTSYC_12750 [Promethearchaeota archaeon]
MVLTWIKSLLSSLFIDRYLNDIQENIDKLNFLYYQTNSEVIKNQIEPRINFLQDLLWLFRNTSINKRKIIKIIKEIKKTLLNMRFFPY